MEGVYSNVRSSGSNSSKAPKVKSLTGDVSPIVVPPPPQRFIGGHSRGRYHPLPSSPIFDPYASSDSPNSPLMRYLRSAGSTSNTGGRMPLASVENLIDAVPPAMFNTPVKVEEDVLVMDGILVTPKTTTPRLRSSLASSNSGGRSASSSSSSGGKENSNSNSNSSSCKTDTCRSWEESGSCRPGAKCLFVHGKEELRPNSTRQTSKSKAEAQICKAYSLGSCTYGTKCRFAHHQVKSTVPPTKPQVQQPAITAMTLPMAPETVSPVKLEQQTSSSSRSSTPTGFTDTDWSPMDDGIEVTLPSSSASSREDVDAYIHTMLYGPARGRLQVFTEFCPDSSP